MNNKMFRIINNNKNVYNNKQISSMLKLILKSIKKNVCCKCIKSYFFKAFLLFYEYLNLFFVYKILCSLIQAVVYGYLT